MLLMNRELGVLMPFRHSQPIMMNLKQHQDHLIRHVMDSFWVKVQVLLIVEEYEHAKARGAKIYAELVGTGMTADAYHLTAPHPEGLGAM